MQVLSEFAAACRATAIAITTAILKTKVEKEKLASKLGGFKEPYLQ